MKKNQKGFSLIELIIALAILIILTGLASMQVMKHIDKSRSTACMHDMGVVADTYSINMAHKSQWDKDTAFSTLNETMKEFDAEEEKASIEGMYAVYTGICKDGGKYQIQFSSDYSNISVACSKHGEWKLDVVQLQDVLSSLTFSNSSYGPDATFTYKNLDDYFKNDGSKRLNSEAVSTGKDYGTAGSLAGVVADAMKKQGINIGTKSWTMLKKNGNYVLYLTDTKLSLDDVGKTVTCTVYDGSKVVQKEMKVEKKGSGSDAYPLLKV